MVIKPNFLIIGAMKSATTSLHQVLKSHPKIWMPENKEPNYFSKVACGHPSILGQQGDHWQAYLSLFKDANSNATLIGEASTDYTKYPNIQGVPQMIKERLGSPKMIYILRDPVNRTISHYKHVIISRPKSSIPSLQEIAVHDPIIFNTSRYIIQLEEYWKIFDKSQIYITTFEALTSNFEEEILKILSFLNVEKGDWSPQLPQVNSAEQLARLVALNQKFGFLPRVKKAIPKKILPIISKLLPLKTPEIIITEKDKEFVKKELKADTEKLNNVLGYELYKP